MKVVAIFSFPLDLELTSFGTLSKLAKTGNQVQVVVVGNTLRSWTRKCKGLLYESCRKIHIDNVLFTDRFDYSSVTQDNALVLNSIIQRVIPELVIIPFWKSYNYKHNILSKTSLIACRGIGNILMYNFSKNTKFNPNIYVTLSEQEASNKLESLSEYWPLINRQFYRSNLRPKTSILQKHDDKVLQEQIASFLRQRIHNQKRFLLDNLNWDKINSGNMTNKRTLNFTLSQASELSEAYESHRVLLV